MGLSLPIEIMEYAGKKERLCALYALLGKDEELPNVNHFIF